MPIYLRNFYFNKLVEQKKQEKQEMDKMKSKSSNKNKIHTPYIPNKR